MAATAMISIFCPDRTGLIAAIAGHLFYLGANLGDAGFTVLGAGAEFNAVCEIPNDMKFAEIQAGLAALPELADAEITIRAFALDPVHGPTADITHQITISGGNQPGLVARLYETLVEFNANIVALNAAAAARWILGIGTPGPIVDCTTRQVRFLLFSALQSWFASARLLQAELRRAADRPH